MLVTLAGQPNSGKSTLFNMLTGARQHVANYPGVTVEKKTGFFSLNGSKAELVDLPGTYSLTSYSLEETVARDFLLHAAPDITINVVDASNLKRNLYLTLQLLEMEVPLVLVLNMMDVAERRSITIDDKGLAAHLNVAVVPTVGKRRDGAAPLLAAVATSQAGKKSSFALDYQALEPHVEKLRAMLEAEHLLEGLPSRWLAVKLMESDESATELLQKRIGQTDAVLDTVRSLQEAFTKEAGITPGKHITYTRHRTAASIAAQFVSMPEERVATLSDRTDRFVCHRVFGPIILVAILLALYQISIVYGGDLATYIWPMWEYCQIFLTKFLPASTFLHDPLSRSLALWVMKSVTAILNYLPIFFLLFALIAILEDSGYMPRMAFILDRAFRRFGLHGQSTLPLILGGVYVGGCAIPAVMATRAIPDEKARLATILITPMMNCLAKVPLYLILISAYFAEHSGMAMFFIATVTLFMALPVAKCLSLTLLRAKPCAPFIMEMPPYHLPTVRGILSRAIERVWLFVKKIFTVILAVSITIFALITFPGPGNDHVTAYQLSADEAINSFLVAVGKTSLADTLQKEDIMPMLQFDEDIKNAKRGVTNQETASSIDARFREQNALYFSIVRAADEDGRALRPALRKLLSERKRLRREFREKAFESSFLGLCGKGMEPVTQYAGFTWKINIALLSAFAAKENSAATLGAIYGIDDDAASVQASMKAGELEFGPLHALALMLFMALYPPCIPTSVMVRLQANSTKWMLFSILYQTLLGFFVAVLVFSGGSALGLSGWQAMWAFYALCVTATLIAGIIPNRTSIQGKT